MRIPKCKSHQKLKLQGKILSTKNLSLKLTETLFKKQNFFQRLRSLNYSLYQFKTMKKEEEIYSWDNFYISFIEIILGLSFSL